MALRQEVFWPMVVLFLFRLYLHIEANRLCDVCSLKLPERCEIFTVSQRAFGGIHHHISRVYCNSACFRYLMRSRRLYERVFFQT